MTDLIIKVISKQNNISGKCHRQDEACRIFHYYVFERPLLRCFFENKGISENRSIAADIINSNIDTILKGDVVKARIEYNASPIIEAPMILF